MKPYKYAVIDGDAVLLGDHDAWSHIDGRWQQISNADAFTKGQLIPQQTFISMFGQIESSLPGNAFSE